jgi:hypothetical protein
LHTSYANSSSIINANTAHLVYEIKSESKLLHILSSKDFNISLLKDLIKIAFEHMIHNFQSDCVQHNPHLNYLKIPALLKTTIVVLIEHMKGIVHANDKKGAVDDNNDDDDNMNRQANAKDFDVVDDDDNDDVHVEYIRNAVECYMNNLQLLEHVCLVHVEAVHVEKFLRENFWRLHSYDLFWQFNTVCMARALRWATRPPVAHAKVYEYLKCCASLLKDKYLWHAFKPVDAYVSEKARYINVIFTLSTMLLKRTGFLHGYTSPSNMRATAGGEVEARQTRTNLCVVFVANYLENFDDIPAEEKNGNFVAIEVNCCKKKRSFHFQVGLRLRRC